MSEWKGLDPGGTEQLWESTVLEDVLAIFKANEPFARATEDSPIFDDLEEEFGEITWRNRNADGSFRPIFRKTNPWVKLGLTTPETIDAYVTPLGDELLSREKSVSEVFIEATKNHVEIDGIHSFGVMCKAALELPSEIFSLEDVEYAVSSSYADGTESLQSALDSVRSRKVQFPRDSRRQRTLRAFLNALVTAGALVNVENGWTLNNSEIAKEIADTQARPISATVPRVEPSPLGAEKIPGAMIPTFKEIQPGKRKLPTYDPSGAIASDPIKKALLLEKANSIHETLVEKCADAIRLTGKTPVEDLNSFDLAIIGDQVMIEVKSIHAINAISQLRKAIAQLPEYRWRHRNAFSTLTTSMLIVTNTNPALFVDQEYIRYLTEDRNIKLFWQQAESLVDSTGQSLEEFLTQLS